MPQSDVVEFTPAETADALVDAADRFCDLIGSIEDESVTSRHVPGWTAAEIVRHVTYLPTFYIDISRGEGRLAREATEMPSINAANYRSIDDIAIPDCAALIRDGVAELAELVRSASVDDPPIPFHAGSELDRPGLAGIGIGEYEVHGIDLASALGARWTIPRRAAAISLLASIRGPAAKWVDAEASEGYSGRFEIRFRGGLGVARLSFDDGALTTDPPPPFAPEAIVSADPAAFMQVLYRRQSQWSAIARGQLIAWGRKPWKAMALSSKFLPV